MRPRTFLMPIRPARTAPSSRATAAKPARISTVSIDAARSARPTAYVGAATTAMRPEPTAAVTVTEAARPKAAVQRRAKFINTSTDQRKDGFKANGQNPHAQHQGKPGSERNGHSSDCSLIDYKRFRSRTKCPGPRTQGSPVRIDRNEAVSANEDVGRHQISAGIESRRPDRKSTRLNSSHSQISYAVFCLKKKTNNVH